MRKKVAIGPIDKRRREAGLCVRCGAPVPIIFFKNGRSNRSYYCTRHRRSNARHIRAYFYAMPENKRRALYRKNRKIWQDRQRCKEAETSAKDLGTQPTKLIPEIAGNT